jgi:hypothetical protein
MKTFLLILLFVSISFRDYKYLIKERKKRAFMIYSLILGTAFLLSELHILGIKVKGLNQLVTLVVGLFVENNLF